MDLRLLTTVFSTVFLAELGDKTQLATMLFASEGNHARFTIFVGAASALVLTSAIGVIAGAVIGKYVSPRVLSYVAGAGFVAIGLWTIAKA